MSVVSPPTVGKPNRTQPTALRRERVKVRGTFGAHRAPKVVGVSDEVALATYYSVRAARKAERAWKRSLSKAQRRHV